MTDKKDPAEVALPIEIQDWIVKTIEESNGDLCPCDLHITFYEEIALKAIKWCRENEVRKAFEAGRETDRCLLTTLVQHRYFDFDDYLKAKE